jgi:hypothetical protein
MGKYLQKNKDEICVQTYGYCQCLKQDKTYKISERNEKCGKEREDK